MRLTPPTVQNRMRRIHGCLYIRQPWQNRRMTIAVSPVKKWITLRDSGTTYLHGWRHLRTMRSQMS
jgi:hypothetical protein